MQVPARVTRQQRQQEAAASGGTPAIYANARAIDNHHGLNIPLDHFRENHGPDDFFGSRFGWWGMVIKGWLSPEHRQDNVIRAENLARKKIDVESTLVKTRSTARSDMDIHHIRTGLHEQAHARNHDWRTYAIPAGVLATVGAVLAGGYISIDGTAAGSSFNSTEHRIAGWIPGHHEGSQATSAGPASNSTTNPLDARPSALPAKSYVLGTTAEGNVVCRGLSKRITIQTIDKTNATKHHEAPLLGLYAAQRFVHDPAFSYTGQSAAVETELWANTQQINANQGAIIEPVVGQTFVEPINCTVQ